MQKGKLGKSELAGLADGMSQRAALGLTRRSVICRVGYAAAALLGAKFLVADGPRALAKVAANPPCFDQQSPCGNTGIACGLSNDASPCGMLSSNCPGCLQANGCPAGTAPNGSWTGCCACANGNAKYTVTYTDCCRSDGGYGLTGLPAPCNGPNCFLHVECPRNPATQNWCWGDSIIPPSGEDCGSALLQNNYVCTDVQPSKQKC
jgi:hypothetical protein